MERLGTKEKIASFMQKEKQDYAFKRKYAQIRAEEFRSECDRRGLNCHVSVGGLDSIILYIFLHEVCGIDAPGVSASTLEDQSIQRVHKAIGIINVPPLLREDGTRWTKPKVIQEFGFPVISKEIAGCSDMANVSAGQDNTMVLVEGWRDYSIYADKDTGVMYLLYQRSGTGCTVMLNADGTPKIWQGEE